MRDRALTNDKRLSPSFNKVVDGWWGLFVVVVLLIILLVTIQQDPYWRIIKFVSDGIWITVVVTISAFLLVLLFGLFAALGRLSSKQLIRAAATIYVEVARGIPLLVQLLF